MCKPNIKCEVCGEEFYKKPFRIKKDVNHTCSMECLGKLRHLTKVRLIESKFDMPIKELLYDLYIVKKLPTRKVGEIIGLSKGKVSEWLKKYDIEVRYGSEAIETQWINNSERRKKQSDAFVENFNIARNNSRFKDFKEYRKTSEYSEWRLKVYSRDNFTCVKCGKKRDSKTMINAHHLESFKTNVEKRYDVNNGVTLCEQCHINFHTKYSNVNNTRTQFEEYLKAD